MKAKPNSSIKLLHARSVGYMETDNTVEAFSSYLNQADKHTLEYAPWSAYQYRPHVQFSIAYTSDAILLKYYVAEKSIRAAVTTINGPVWQDSCVEFFIGFDAGAYYNLEFNCIGTALVGYGTARKPRCHLSKEVINTIHCRSSIDTSGSLIRWELTAVIPLKLFTHYTLNTLAGRVCRVNFYKCGDALPEPHFLCWSQMHSNEPDFHLPQFFGEVLFD